MRIKRQISCPLYFSTLLYFIMGRKLWLTKAKVNARSEATRRKLNSKYLDAIKNSTKIV
jgi:hypothetical protein